MTNPAIARLSQSRPYICRQCVSQASRLRRQFSAGGVSRQDTKDETNGNVLELLEASRRSSQRLVLDDGDSHSLAIFAAVLVTFFAVCYPLMALSSWLERRIHA